MTAPTSPALHDLVHWQGARWLVTRLLRFGRVEVTAMHHPGVQWIVLQNQLTWVSQNQCWICRALPMPMRGTRCDCED